MRAGRGKRYEMRYGDKEKGERRRKRGRGVCFAKQLGGKGLLKRSCAALKGIEEERIAEEKRRNVWGEKRSIRGGMAFESGDKFVITFLR